MRDRLLSQASYPAFPNDVPTAPLLSISLRDLESGVGEASNRLSQACQDFGFFYLDLEGDLGEALLREAEELDALQQLFFDIPHEEKDQYGRDKVDPFFSYRWVACKDGVKDHLGRPGRREMYSLRVDDFVSLRSSPLARHPMVDSTQPLFSSFMRHCREVVWLLLRHCETHLRLPRGTLLDLHAHDRPVGDFVTLQHRASEPYDEAEISRGEHTDFGSITMLFNWLGGLQIRNQVESRDGSTLGQWVYVKPIPGSCIINLGDSIVKLTSGLLKSNVHRVVPAPGPQANLPRDSLVYFAHPNDDVLLRPVRGGLVDTAPPPGKADDASEQVTAFDWTMRRSLGDLRGVYTYHGGIELRENNDAVAAVQKQA